MANTKGIDISKWQGDITFSKVASSTGFVIMKATEGYGYTDPKFKRNQQGLRNAGVPVGYYHFARPDLKNSAIREADWFLSEIGALRKGEVLALDYEVNYSDPVNWCKAFLDRVKEKTGVKPLLYINLDTNNKYDWGSVVKGDYGLWLAYWDGSLTYKPKTDWAVIAIKQYGADTKVDGIVGNVDGNVFYGDIATFKKYGYQGAVEAPPPVQTEYEKELAILKTENEELKKALSLSEDRVKKLEDDIKGYKAEVEVCHDELKASSDRMIELENLTKDLTNKNAEIIKELAEWRGEATKKVLKETLEKIKDWFIKVWNR